MMKELLERIEGDIEQAQLNHGNKRISVSIIPRLIFSRTFRVIVFVRLSQLEGVVGWVSRFFLRRRFIEIGHIELSDHFFLPHPQSIIIASGVKIGSHVHVGQYVTIGGNFKKAKTLPDGSKQRLPVIGNRVMIHPGAVIGGPVTIGDDVIIGANSVVTVDVPSGTLVFGQNQFSKKKISIPPQGGYYKVVS